MAADYSAQGASPVVCGVRVGSGNEITARLRGLSPKNLHLLRQEAFEFLKPGCSEDAEARERTLPSQDS